MNPILTIKAERPFANNSITFTCNSTVQRWPEYVPSKLSYQYFGNPRGYTNGNKLILKSLTKSDTGIDVSCQATDDRGKASNMSNTVTLGQYCKYNLVISIFNDNYSVVAMQLRHINASSVFYTFFGLFFYLLLKRHGLVLGRCNGRLV